MTREREYFFGEDKMRGGRGGGRGGGGGGGSFVHKSQIVKQLKETMQAGHRTGLPPKLLEYFQPRPGLKPGADLSRKKHPVPFTGLSSYVHMFAGPQDPEEVKDVAPKTRLFRNPELNLQCRLNGETKLEKHIRLTQWKKEEAISKIAEAAKSWDPHKDSRIEGDPFRTLFVGNLDYDMTEKKLKKSFEEYGPIKSVRIVSDKTGKSRGYAFIEYEDKKDMKEAYKRADGKKIGDGRRAIVDFERGRTIETWKPRRLGGGQGAPKRVALPPKPKNAMKRGLVGLPPPETPAPHEDPRGGGGPPPRARSPARPDRGPDRFDRDRERMDRERRDRERVDRERVDRERRDRERPMDVDRDRKRDRDRDTSPRRDRDRDDGSKRRREYEDGEVRESRGGRDYSPDRRRRD